MDLTSVLSWWVCPQIPWNGDDLAPGDHQLTLADLRSSELVVGDGSSPTWDQTWRGGLVSNLGTLLAHLERVKITEVFIDGSFCSKKDRPGDIDGYFLTDLPGWPQVRRRLVALDRSWDLNVRYPDAQGKPKPLMWHRYKVELFPVFNPPFKHLSTGSGGNPPVTIDEFFHQSRSGARRGVVRVHR